MSVNKTDRFHYTLLYFLQLSCVSSSPDLTDRNRFRNYFQLLNSEVTLAYAYFAMIKEYGWGHVSLIVQDENLFTEVRPRCYKQLLYVCACGYEYNY